jgi:hypothetical protein
MRHDKRRKALYSSCQKNREIIFACTLSGKAPNNNLINGRTPGLAQLNAFPFRWERSSGFDG